MGGKAFGFEAKRMDKEEYESTLELTLERINTSNEHGCFGKGVISYSEKDSFGDIDILVPREHFSFENFWEKHKFRYKEFKKNGGVISLLDKRDRQIDIITTPSDIYWIHFNYLAYNDMGNFIGRIAKSLNLKYGHDGLSLIVRDPLEPSRKLGLISISKNVEYIYDLLDLPYRCYDRMEQIYSDIMSSKFYHKDSFLLENQSNHARVRDRKRKSYHGLLNYIKENDKTESVRRKYTIEETLLMLPRRITNEYMEMVGNSNKERYEKTLFNGKIVSDLTNLKGKELGAFISKIKGKVDIYGDVEQQVLAFYQESINQGE